MLLSMDLCYPCSSAIAFFCVAASVTYMLHTCCFIPNIENVVVVCGLKFILVERRKPCVVAGKLK